MSKRTTCIQLDDEANANLLQLKTQYDLMHNKNYSKAAVIRKALSELCEVKKKKTMFLMEEEMRMGL